jgi:hypothetical protein
MHVASLCFKYFIRMLQVFHLGVAYVCNWYTRVFKFFLVFCKCFSYFRRMLQVFHLDVAKEIKCCTCYNGTRLLHPPTAAARVPPWVIVRAPEADLRI